MLPSSPDSHLKAKGMTGVLRQRKTTFWERAVTVGLLVTCLRVWLGPLPFTETAYAQIPDSGKQRKQLIEEVRQTNQLLREVKQILTSHIFNVRIEGADNHRDRAKVRPRP